MSTTESLALDVMRKMRDKYVRQAQGTRSTSHQILMLVKAEVMSDAIVKVLERRAGEPKAPPVE